MLAWRRLELIKPALMPTIDLEVIKETIAPEVTRVLYMGVHFIHHMDFNIATNSYISTPTSSVEVVVFMRDKRSTTAQLVYQGSCIYTDQEPTWIAWLDAVVIPHCVALRPLCCYVMMRLSDPASTAMKDQVGDIISDAFGKINTIVIVPTTRVPGHVSPCVGATLSDSTIMRVTRELLPVLHLSRVPEFKGDDIKLEAAFHTLLQVASAYGVRRCRLIDALRGTAVALILAWRALVVHTKYA